MCARIGRQDPESAQVLGGKLTKSKRASVVTALLSEVDEDNLIYADADDMALFFY